MAGSAVGRQHLDGEVRRAGHESAAAGGPAPDERKIRRAHGVWVPRKQESRLRCVERPEAAPHDMTADERGEQCRDAAVLAAGRIHHGQASENELTASEAGGPQDLRGSRDRHVCVRPQS
jgi:hypothetical protein